MTPIEYVEQTPFTAPDRPSLRRFQAGEKTRLFAEIKADAETLLAGQQYVRDLADAFSSDKNARFAADVVQYVSHEMALISVSAAAQMITKLIHPDHLLGVLEGGGIALLGTRSKTEANDLCEKDLRDGVDNEGFEYVFKTTILFASDREDKILQSIKEIAPYLVRCILGD